MFFHKKKQAELARTIKKAIDSYPDGLSFSTLGGRPILVNHCMNELIYHLTGHTLLQVNATWDELSHGTLTYGVQRLSAFQITENMESSKVASSHVIPQTMPQRIPHSSSDSLYFQFPDKHIWQLQKNLLNTEGQPTIQIVASDITDLYQLMQDQYERNRQLISMHERERALLDNIVQVNQEKELLSAKVRIHDELGRCLLATKKALADGVTEDEQTDIARAWLSTLKNLENISHEAKPKKDSSEAELKQVAALIGCEIEFIGDPPQERTAELLYYAAIREALTNSVRHANATKLFVETTLQNNQYHVKITDNHHQEIAPIKEGVGLGSLRNRIEQEGGHLTILSNNGVVLLLNIPKREDS